jgi:hypothetical protein
MFICGTDNQILEASEPEKCEYLFRIASPIVWQEIIEKKVIKKSMHEAL